ncbi:MAG: acyl-CoA dehydrogenase [Planctomycetota bacterium]|jgi:acyl-CoA dehydrogenase
MIGTSLAIVAVVLTLGYLGAPLAVWTLVIGGICFWLGMPTWFILVLAVPFLAFCVPALRSQLVAKKLAGILKKAGLLPVISETEQVALEAGTVWMDGELFSGAPDAKKLLEPEIPTLRPDEQQFLDGPVEEACKLVDDLRCWQDKDLPPELWAFLKENRFFGLIVPKEHGGLALSATGLSAVIHKLASRSFALSVTVMIPNSLGPAELLHHYGTDEQKSEFLPKLASGEHMPCFALTEPGAGSDAGAIAAEGVVFKDDDGTLKLKLNWDKRYTSLATVSTIIGLAFKLRDPENLIGKGVSPGITCALIPTTTPGVTANERHDPLGVPFHNCAIFGKDVIVPVDAIIGGPAFAGQGWRMLMECLAAGRGVALPAAMVANSKLVSRTAGAYSMLRYQFGMPIGKFEGIEEPLSRIGAMTYMMEAGRRYTNASIDAGHKPSVISAIVKCHFTELSRRITNDGMDILAGAGISRGPRNLLANSHIASPIAITVEGANILTRSMIIFGQGAMRCHPFARAQVEALQKDDFAAFDRAFFGHVRHFVRNLFRSVLLSVTRGWLARSPVTGPTANYWRKLKWASASFALLSDCAMVSLGGKLKRHERLSARLGDILSWMYFLTAVLKRYETDGRQKEDLPLVKLAAEECLAEIQAAFDGAFANFPVPYVGFLMRGPIGIWSRLNAIGRKHHDVLGSQVADILRRPGAQRERLFDLMHIPASKEEALGRLEQALVVANESLSVSAKIKQAMKDGKLGRGRPERMIDGALEAGVINDEEAACMRAALEAKDDAVKVDSFHVDVFQASTPTPGFAPTSI